VKPPKDLRPLTDIRVTRKTNVEVELGDFSFAEDSSDTLENQLQRVALSMQGIPPEQISNILKARQNADMSSLAETLRIEGVKLTMAEDHLLVELESAAFRSGDYRLSPQLKSQMAEVVKRLEPFKGKLSMTVIGHTDKRPMIAKNEFLKDNFDLSSIRALNALKYVLQQGFPENQASARAASSFDRDARSITLELRVSKSEKSGEST
jgi:flagellar motor protein MotB